MAAQDAQDITNGPSIPAVRHPFSARYGLVVVGLSILCGLATYVILTGLTPVKPTRSLILTFMAANLTLVTIMVAMIAWHIWKLFAAQRAGLAGAGLHIRLVGLFSVIAAVPAIIVAIFASVTLNRGLDAWFSQRTQSIVDTAITVAQAYIRESGERVRGDTVAIAADLNQHRELFDTDKQTFLRRLASNAVLHRLTAAYVIDRNNRRIDASATSNSRVLFRAPNDEAFGSANAGELVVMGPGDDNIMRGLVKLANFDNRYLYLYRAIDPTVLQQLATAQQGREEFNQLLGQRQGVQLTFALMYGGVSFIFLLSAIWLALWFADRIADPIVNLVNAARRVAAGDLGAKVSVTGGPGDLRTLGHTFNRMMEQLKNQRDELVDANQLADTRRRFMEAVLSGVSAGVIGLDSHGKITLVNRAAAQLLGLEGRNITGHSLAEVLPDFATIYDQSINKLSRSGEGQVSLKIAGEDRSFLVRITIERSREAEHGHVMTFDDITEVVSAQRNSAWADIARRIAHEIKNPLTPIQLSAERLRRKYGKEIHSDPQVFEQCTQTIIRQVGDIGRMVDEFSSFARMPSAVREPQDLYEVVREATVLQRVSSSDIRIDVDIPDEPLVFPFDRRLVSQAITNLVKNARESIEARRQKPEEPAGRILVRAGEEDESLFIEVTDNGVGLPKEHRHRLTEPYMTTRAKGTGLGLAIVKRIMEEHDGRLMLQDAPASFDGGIGARVRLMFPRPGTTVAVEEPVGATAEVH